MPLPPSTAPGRWLARPRLACALLAVCVTLAPAPAAPRLLRFVSSPDLINADVEDNAPRAFDMDEEAPDYAARRQVVVDARLVSGRAAVPGYPEHSDPPHPHDRNQDGILSVQEGYRGGLQHLLEHIAAERPDAFLVSGDLVDGEWATQSGKLHSSAALPVREAHVRAQADIYYDAYFSNFRRAGYHGPIYSVIGDHELGDNEWPAGKVQLLPAFHEVYRQKMRMPETVAGDGAYVDAPAGREGRWWAKQHGNTLLVGLETFDMRYDATGRITAVVTGNKRALMPADHLAWIEQTLAKARQDSSVEHIIVMGHCPFDVAGVRSVSSSDLRLAGGTNSALWQLFEQYKVTLYLAGEVHAVSGFKRNGVTQLVTAGNQFSDAASNYLVIDVYPDRLQLTLKEAAKVIYGFRSDDSDPINDDNSRSSEWRTRQPYRVVGTATLYTGGARPALVQQTGQLATYVVDEDEASDPTTLPPWEPAADDHAAAGPPPEVPRSVRPRLLSSAAVGEVGAHPGVALPLWPARDAVILFGLVSQHEVPFVIEPMLVDGRPRALRQLHSRRSDGLTTAIYGAEIGPVRQAQTTTIGGTLRRADTLAEQGQTHFGMAVQGDGFTLAGFQEASARGNASPVAVGFTGRTEDTLILVVGGHHPAPVGLTLGPLLPENAFNSSRNGHYRTGAGMLGGQVGLQLRWDSTGSHRGAGLAAVAVNPLPRLQSTLAASPGGGTLAFRWPATLGAGVRLQTATTPEESAGWTEVPQIPTLAGAHYAVEVPLSAPAAFFRLRIE